MRSMNLQRLFVGLAGALLFVLTANGQPPRGKQILFFTQLSGYNEVAALSSPARGRIVVFIDDRSDAIQYRLSYSGFETPVAQSHLHLGQRHTNGGISVFLCTNLGNGPAGTPACPEGGGVVTGVLTADGVLGPAGQGIAAGELNELINAIRAGAVYVNVHTQAFPAGEIRGQLD